MLYRVDIVIGVAGTSSAFILHNYDRISAAAAGTATALYFAVKTGITLANYIERKKNEKTRHRATNRND